MRTQKLRSLTFIVSEMISRAHSKTTRLMISFGKYHYRNKTQKNFIVFLPIAFRCIFNANKKLDATSAANATN